MTEGGGELEKPWMRSETVPRCETCGLRLEDGEAGLCKSCAYRRKKAEQRAAAQAAAQAEAPGAAAAAAPAPAEAPKGPDVAELRERLRRVEEGLRE
ncbi:MAG TPA: hypothetical protein VF244_05915 [Acidimicrobiales bacterium]